MYGGFAVWDPFAMIFFFLGYRTVAEEIVKIPFDRVIVIWQIFVSSVRRYMQSMGFAANDD